MSIDLSTDEVRILIEALPYAKRAKQEGSAPLELRQADEAVIEGLSKKLRAEQKSLASSSS